MKATGPMPDSPFISIILPVRNEARSLPSLLGSLAEQNYPLHSFEIVVADGRSTDDTRTVVSDFAARSPATVLLVDNPGIRSGPGRNAGLAAARGDLILFVDGHCHVPSQYLLRDTAAIFRQTQADCLCRPQPLLAPADDLGRLVAAARASRLGHGRDSLIYDLTATGIVDPASSGAAYRRAVFNAIGGYDEQFDACEDVEFNTRVRKAGLHAYTDPRLAVHYEPRSTLRALFLQMARYGRGRLLLMHKHSDTVTAGQLAPAFLSLWMAAAAASCLLPVATWLRIAMCAPVLLYLIVLAVAAFSLSRTHGAKSFLPAIAVYGAIHLGLGFGLWIEAFSLCRRILLSQTASGRPRITECKARQQRG